MIWAWSLASVTLVSAVSLIGVLFVSMGERRVHRVASVLVSFAVGALLGDAFIHLIPEALRDSRNSLKAPLLCLGGILLFFVVEKLVRHGFGGARTARWSLRRPELAAVNLIGDGIHNFIDGVMIAASYLASPTLGISTTLAVLFHEIPQELGDFGILIRSGLSVRKALLLNLLSAAAAILGTLLTLVAGRLGGSWVAMSLLPVAAGEFVYLAAADLLPEMQQEGSLKGSVAQLGWVVFGIAVMAALKLGETGHGG